MKLAASLAILAALIGVGIALARRAAVYLRNLEENEARALRIQREYTVDEQAVAVPTGRRMRRNETGLTSRYDREISRG